MKIWVFIIDSYVFLVLISILTFSISDDFMPYEIDKKS